MWKLVSRWNTDTTTATNSSWQHSLGWWRRALSRFWSRYLGLTLTRRNSEERVSCRDFHHATGSFTPTWAEGDSGNANAHNWVALGSVIDTETRGEIDPAAIERSAPNFRLPDSDHVGTFIMLFKHSWFEHLQHLAYRVLMLAPKLGGSRWYVM